MIVVKGFRRNYILNCIDTSGSELTCFVFVYACVSTKPHMEWCAFWLYLALHPKPHWHRSRGHFANICPESVIAQYIPKGLEHEMLLLRLFIEALDSFVCFFVTLLPKHFCHMWCYDWKPVQSPHLSLPILADKDWRKKSDLKSIFLNYVPWLKPNLTIHLKFHMFIFSILWI